MIIMYMGLFSSQAYIGYASASKKIFNNDGHVTHGANSFNDRIIADFSLTSNIFTSIGALPEIGVFNPGANNASRILDSTPLSSFMASLDAFDFQRAIGAPPGQVEVNIPISRTPLTIFTSSDINDRVAPRRFAESVDPDVQGMPYTSEAADADVTLRQWNQVAARLRIICKGSRAVARVRIQNGLPNSLYTMWDVGVLDALRSTEELSAAPFGGVPNVITTDSHGSGSADRTLNYCPLDGCPGSRRCTVYVSLLTHFDRMIYGGTPSVDFAGPAIGNVGSNHIQFFINGQVLFPPQNKFKNWRW